MSHELFHRHGDLHNHVAGLLFKWETEIIRDFAVGDSLNAFWSLQIEFAKQACMVAIEFNLISSDDFTLIEKALGILKAQYLRHQIRKGWNIDREGRAFARALGSLLLACCPDQNAAEFREAANRYARRAA
ncbi:MAG: hypothetical protein JWO82_2111 [Akkermansiaceae bacterium]|nr:hypothetical protein [Akkermansiaceae bacterium]